MAEFSNCPVAGWPDSPVRWIFQMGKSNISVDVRSLAVGRVEA